MTNVSFKELDAAVDEACDEIDRLRAENAELLAALKLLLEVQSGWPERCAVARAAIAKAEVRS